MKNADPEIKVTTCTPINICPASFKELLFNSSPAFVIRAATTNETIYEIKTAYIQYFENAKTLSLKVIIPMNAKKPIKVVEKTINAVLKSYCQRSNTSKKLNKAIKKYI